MATVKLQDLCAAQPIFRFSTSSTGTSADNQPVVIVDRGAPATLQQVLQADPLADDRP
ncbi:hypothetical protein [Cryobacterium sp. Y57]|uniref:hypothetical protein n=1 Tax=Cryobacterium sp. Y57 TaxID=2048287 RepID=UPI001304D7BE|nr:hypothetical protein [Cryobacterium sp. Y57]